MGGCGHGVHTPRQGWGICKHCCWSLIQGYGLQGVGRGFPEEQTWSCCRRGVRKGQRHVGRRRGPGTAVAVVTGGGDADGRRERIFPLDGGRSQRGPATGEQCGARWAARGGVDGRRTCAEAQCPCRACDPPPTLPPPHSLPDGQQVEERPLSCLHYLILRSQDPEFQKHATQILRDMLRQEERELQVRSPPRTGRPPSGSSAGSAACQCACLTSQAMPR